MRKKNNGETIAGQAVSSKHIWQTAVFLMVLAAFLLLASGRRTLADVIWTPDDSFYEKNYSDCEYVGRRYYANGAEGYVTVMEEPAKGKILDYIPNGPIFFVSMSYDKGASGAWGLVQYVLDENGSPVEDYSWGEGAAVGWIKMADLLVVYDGYSFAEEYQDRIQKADENTSPKLTMPENGVIYLWEYPGSEVSYGKLTSLENDLVFDQMYEDPAGDLWGHSVYYYGYKNFWINLSSPDTEKTKENTEINEKSVPRLTPPADEKTLERLSKTGGSAMGLPAAVAGLIVLTIVLTIAVIRFMAEKKKRDETDHL